MEQNIKYRLYYHQPKDADNGRPRDNRDYNTFHEALSEERRAIEIGLIDVEMAAVINNSEPDGWCR